MEKQIITEIDRIKEIMKVTVISESVGPAKQILNKIFTSFWDSGDNALKNIIIDSLETQTQKGYNEISRFLDEIVNGTKTIDQLETQFPTIKFRKVLDDVLSKTNGEKYLDEVYNIILDDNPDLSKLLKDAKNNSEINFDDLKNTNPQLHDDIVDGLTTTRQTLDEFFEDDPELAAIIREKTGLDNIPEKVNVVAPVVDNVKDVTKKQLLAKNWNDIVPLSDEEIANLRRANPLWDTVVNEWGKSLSDMVTGEVALIEELQSSIKSLRDMLKSPDKSTENVGALTQRIGDLILKLRNKQSENFTSIDAWIKKNVPDSGIIAKIQDTDGYRMAKHLGTKEFLKEWEAKYLTKVEGEKNLLIQLNSVFNPLSWLRTNNMKKWGGDNLFERSGNKWSKIIYGPEFKKFRNKLLFGWDNPPKAYYQYAKGFGWYKTLGKMGWEYIKSRMVLLSFVALLDYITDLLGAGLYSFFPNWEWAKKQSDSWSLSMGFESEEDKKRAKEDESTSSEGIKKLLQQFKYYFSNNLNNITLASPMIIDDLSLVYDAITNPSTEEDVKKVQELIGRTREAAEEARSQADSVVTTHGIPVPEADVVIDGVISDSNSTEETEIETNTIGKTELTPDEAKRIGFKLNYYLSELKKKDPNAKVYKVDDDDKTIIISFNNKEYKAVKKEYYWYYEDTNETLYESHINKKRMINQVNTKTLKESIRNKVLLKHEEKKYKIKKINENLRKFEENFYYGDYNKFFDKMFKLAESYKKSKLYLNEDDNVTFDSALIQSGLFKGQEDRMKQEFCNYVSNKLGLEGEVKRNFEDRVTNYPFNDIGQLFTDTDKMVDMIYKSFSDSISNNSSTPDNFISVLQSTIKPYLKTADFERNFKSNLTSVSEPIMDNARKKVDNLVMKIKELLAKEESKG